MIKSDKTAEGVLKRWESLKSQRLPYETQWNEIQLLVRIHTKSLYQSQEGNRRFDGIYDGTAVEALEQLGSGCHSYLTNPSERWFGLEIEADYFANQDPVALLWLETVADIIYDVYKNEETNFNSALHEGYLDLGAFGHCVIYQEEDHKSCVRFSTYPISDCWVAEGFRGKVDTIIRKSMMTGRNIIAEFEGDNIPDVLRKPENQDKEFTVLHYVCPRKDRNVTKFNAQNKAFASFYVLAEEKVTLSESGYDIFPYHVPRWFKLSDEKYGRSPAMKCLPDIKMLNKMEYVTLKAGTKAVDPALVVPDDGFMLPIKTHPGAIIFKEPNAGEIQTLEHKGNLPWAEDKMAQKRAAIEKAFHADWLRMEKENQEMTAYEVADRRDEKLRLLAPMIGRLQGELLGPMLVRTYNILSKRGKIPPAPANLQDKKLKLVYISPASKAQSGSKAVGIGRLINDLAPLAQLDPTVMDALDLDAVTQELALARGTTRRILRSPEALAQLRADRAKQQQVSQMAEMAEPASKAALNMAKAREAGGGIGV
jgi:hypothetical protein